MISSRAPKRTQTPLDGRKRPLRHVLWLVLALLLAVAPVAVASADSATPENFALNQSRKTASSNMVRSGETFTYTIELVNSGTETLLVWVADPVPGLLTYVPGSASHSGEFHADSSTLTWEVNVEGESTVPLTFQVTAGDVAAATDVTNVAAISSVYQRFMRMHNITILPDDGTPPPADSDLTNSRKVASKSTLSEGESMTYTIELANSGDADATAMVTDPIPSQLAYVEGSATGGATYDSATMTLTWENTVVAANSTVALTFEVQAKPVTMPTTVTNRATIVAGGDTLVRSASVLVIPGSTPPPTGGDLSDSRKLASVDSLETGETLVYTIQLVNSGDADATVDVSDRVPDAMTYVDGSASAPGVYNADSKTLSWDDIPVPAGGTVDLTFEAMAGEVRMATPVVNRAAIASDTQRFTRAVTVMVLPADAPMPPQPHPILIGSRKVASQRSVAGGEGLTYTINLVNSGTADALVDVTDPLPNLVTYNEGTASHSGSYDADTRTLNWADVPVAAGETVALTFEVTTSAVDRPTLVVNTATVTADAEGHEHEMKARVLLLPVEPPNDVRPPRVASVRIADSDVLTDPEVMLYISAMDDVAVQSMKIQEWVLTSAPIAHWELVETTDWMPFQAETPWTLSDRSGTHYVGVWVADGAGNTSQLGQHAMDFASLLLPGESLSAGAKIAYMVYYQSGAEVTATLETISGDADLYVWFAGEHGLPSAYSNEEGTAVDQVTFTAPTTGRYLFVVHGYQESTYNLAIAPGGSLAKAANSSPASTKPVLRADTILTASGLDPVAGADAPRARYFTHLPAIIR